ncbi:sensor histidine kinase [Propionibacteriaceae bacterium Y1700]|uniref:sensor histidine kinase n=1 Tax=Microlunatus sp. Y1700 TaxID=3418487 RepID=UPI003DA7512B
MIDQAEPGREVSPQPPAMSGNGRRLEWYIKITLYLLAPGFLLGGLLSMVSTLSATDRPVSPGESARLIVLIILGLATAAANLVVAHVAISRMRLPRDQWWRGPRWRWAVWIGITLVATFGWATFLWTRGAWPSPLWMFGTAAVVAVTPLLGWRSTTIATVLLIMINTVATMLSPMNPELRWIPITSIAIAIPVITFTQWLTVWMLRVVYELDDARRRAAELAITEERLRIARDLHDVLGKTLTTVAVKSGLAAELVRRGRSTEAEAEMAAVRQIADDAAKETRTVVRGERMVDLARELDGAKALLDSAGIACTVQNRVHATRLDQQRAGILGWVVREGVTNIIRHSNATRCLISLSPDPLRLMITNNGVHSTPDPQGTGLRGMAERLAAAGGTLEHERDGNSFTLTATLEEYR